MILIIGASGFLGREVTKLLLSKGEQVRLLVRTPSKVEDLQQAGAEVMQGDLIDPPSLVRACQGVDRVLAAAHSLLGKGRYKSEAVDDTGHHSLIDIGKAAGVAHFVYMSMLGVSPNHPFDFARRKYFIEEYLKASGMTHTILRSSWYMEQNVHLFNGKSILESGKTSLLGKGTKLRNFVAARDVAQLAVRALLDPTLKNRTIDIGGPQNVTNNQVAELYGKIAGVTPKISHMPPFMAKAMSIALKPVQPGISRIMYLGSLPDDAFCETFDPAILLAEFPIHLTTLEEFIRDRIAETKNV
ncbi:MAG TPA: SDR family oxidoreductase [Anaerolineales bacterium]|nr:SDR family oxidoreductase [Anaerolineales bacterium]